MPSNCGVGEDSWESLGESGDQTSQSKRNQPWILTGRNDAEVEAPVFLSSNENSQFFGKVPDAWKDWRQKHKSASEDEIAGWRHQCNGYELGQTLGDVRDREAWHAAVHGVTKSQAWLGNWTTTTTKLGIIVQLIFGQCGSQGLRTLCAVDNSCIAYIDPLYRLFLCVFASPVSVVPHLWIERTMDWVVG